jgi:hypothetical protein
LSCTQVRAGGAQPVTAELGGGACPKTAHNTDTRSAHDREPSAPGARGPFSHSPLPTDLDMAPNEVAVTSRSSIFRQGLAALSSCARPRPRLHRAKV